jgi:hypothetical protein
MSSLILHDKDIAVGNEISDNGLITSSVIFTFHPGAMGSCSSLNILGPYEPHTNSSLPHVFHWKRHSKPSFLSIP